MTRKGILDKFLSTGQDQDLPIIDAHMHYWDLEENYHPWLCEKPLIPFRYGDYTAICTSFMPNDYKQLLDNHLVLDTVYMEAEWHPSQGLDEVKWIHSLHQASGQPVGMIAQAWLNEEDIEDYLSSIATYPLVRGIRHKPAWCELNNYRKEHTLPGSMNCPHWEKGYALLAKHNLLFELQTPWWHLPDLIHLLEKYPDTTVVINHAGVPGDREPETLKGWYDNLRVISEYPNVFIKVSGIGEQNHPWTLERNGQLIRSIILLFGTSRVMFASNFPVDSLCVDYKTLFDCFKTITSDFSEQEKLNMFYLNATNIYKTNKQPTKREKETQ
ncbi:purine/pyrimidine phosphoribosyl transferase [Vibrio ishigakensis]|uniref:Purine/pyrimidine phosphoribosyl transferase n=1 Tax=Vibrio ishigakensis TaxID=1481914 RepID=A0A0B8QGW9_9VIBR|nr:purine/pyrimidine phosphoribosyl transferase [Vibrio ishigakensis]